jgi:hypothetical protein
MIKKEKCTTCKHPLDEHYGEYCLHYHNDISRRCRCTMGSDGIAGNKKFVNKSVASVITAGDNFVWFIDNSGNHWRWMYKYRQNFKVDVV